MKRIVLSAALLATFGLAAAATAGEQGDHRKPRTASVVGRQMVWQEPKAEQPYALRGQKQEADRTAEEPRIELQPHGRSGTSVEVDRSN